MKKRAYTNFPTRYLLFPKGQMGRNRPIPGSGQSHIAITFERTDVLPSQKRDFRKTLCGLVMRRETQGTTRYDWKRYYATEGVEWDKVTCEQCRRHRGMGPGHRW